MWVWYLYDEMIDEHYISVKDYGPALIEGDFGWPREQCWMVPGTVDPNE